MEGIDKKTLYIVENHLDELASGDAGIIAENTGIEVEEVKKIFKTVRSLEPRPGREFFGDETLRTVIADAIVRKMNGRFETLINEDAFPDVNISDDGMTAGFENIDHDAGVFLHDSVNSAIWLIKCLEQRKNIILKIVEKLVAGQPGFFEKGPKYLQLLDPVLFSDALEMHETIFAKALNGKYFQCRWGTFELKYFFKMEVP